MENNTNRQVLKSKKKIVDSLILLMENNKYEDITIQEICYGAKISRKTYYNNFSSKEDVLLYQLKLLSEDFWLKITDNNQMNIEKLVYSYFQFCYLDIDFIKLLVKHNLFYTILKEYDRFMQNIIFQYFADNDRNIQDDSTLIEYTSIYHSGGLWHILEKWIQRDCDKSPYEMSQIYLKIIKHLE